MYFCRVHDSDNNSKLDGLEILQAIQHTSHEDDKLPDEPDNFNHIVGKHYKV